MNHMKPIRLLAAAGLVTALAGHALAQQPSPLPGPLQTQPQQQRQQSDPVPQRPPAQQQPRAATSDDQLVQSIGIDELTAIAQSLGYTDIRKRNATVFTFAMSGSLVTCYVEKGGDLRLYWSVKKRVAQDVTNTWNRDRRLSRAFIDKQGEPVLEADLLTTAGMTRGQVIATFKSFEQSLRAFKRHIGAQ